MSFLLKRTLLKEFRKEHPTFVSTKSKNKISIKASLKLSQTNRKIEKDAKAEPNQDSIQVKENDSLELCQSNQQVRNLNESDFEYKFNHSDNNHQVELLNSVNNTSIESCESNNQLSDLKFEAEFEKIMNSINICKKRMIILTVFQAIYFGFCIWKLKHK